MIKVRILKESINEMILDEAKEDDAFESYWNEHERDFRQILKWVYGRHSGPGMWQGVVPDMLKKFKEKGKEFAPKRQQRIKYLNWTTDMHKLGYKTELIIKSLKIFEKFSPQFENKQLKSYGSPDEVLQTYKKEVVMKRVGKSRKSREKSEPRATENDRAVVYEDEHLFVVRPHNVDASCHYGRKTKWCIAQTGNDYFREYTEEEGLVFYFIKDDRRKPDDRYAKVAIQVGLNDINEAEIEGFWDRYDNEGIGQVPRNIGELDEFFGQEIYDAMREISNHADNNPPVRGQEWELEQLEEEIDNGDYETHHLTFYAETANFDSPLIEINASIDDSFEIEQLDGFSEENIAIAYEEREDEIRERIEELISEDFYDAESEGFQFEQDPHDAKEMKYHINFQSQAYYSADDAKSWLNDMARTYDDDEIKNIREKMTEIVMQELLNVLNAESRETISNLAKELWNIDSKLKYFYSEYVEEDNEIYFMQKQSFKVPLRIKPFNLETKGYSDNSIIYSKVKRYNGFIKRFAREPIKAAIKRAMEKVDTLARRSAFNQMSIPGIEIKKAISDSQKFPTNFSVLVGIPNINDIIGNTKSKDYPTVTAGVNVWVTALQDKESIKFSVDYIKWIDNHIEEIYEHAMNMVNLDEIRKQIDDKYAEIFSTEDVEALKTKSGFDKEAFTESKRRIKIRIK